MADLTDEELRDLFQSEFPSTMSYQEMSRKLCVMQHEHINELRNKFCDLALDAFIRGFYSWREDFREYLNGNFGGLFMKQVAMLRPRNFFFDSISAFFMGDYDKCLKLLDEAYAGTEVFTTCEIDYSLLPVFKNAFPGFWEHVRKLVNKKKAEPGVIEYINAIEAYYSDADSNTMIEKLTEVYRIDSECVVVKELLARFYGRNKMYKNALAYYEQIDEPTVLYYDNLYFDMGWVYAKLRANDKAIEYYKKCIEVNPNYIYANNNLGYVYIKEKRYDEAIKVLRNALSEQFTYDERKLASNNLVCAYIGAKKITEAKAFASKTKIKLWKYTLDKLKKVEAGECVADEDEENDKEQFSAANKKYSEIRASQFSSERILEDELVLRIESGQPVFGESLKIYRRKGKYGRQYIIPVGRIDLLTEDSKGNLYIIELKKDRGYDDAYKQITAYIDWFAKNKEFKDQKIYGIICLNNPSKGLIEKTTKDERVKLYEYMISYREIK